MQNSYVLQCIWSLVLMAALALMVLGAINSSLRMIVLGVMALLVGLLLTQEGNGG